jgi:hypothetical protein
MQHSPPTPQPQQSHLHQLHHNLLTGQPMPEPQLAQHLSSAGPPTRISSAQFTPQINGSSSSIGQSSTFHQQDSVERHTSRSDLPSTLTTSTISCPQMAPLTGSQVRDLHTPRLSSESPEAIALSNKSTRPQDWKYPMRREMQEIVSGLFLGPFASALPKNVITHFDVFFFFFFFFFVSKSR